MVGAHLERLGFESPPRTYMRVIAGFSLASPVSHPSPKHAMVNWRCHRCEYVRVAYDGLAPHPGLFSIALGPHDPA